MLEIYCDGLCEPQNPNGYGCCAFVVYEKGKDEPIHQQYACIAKPGEGCTNNVAEWRAVRGALRWLEKKQPECHVDIFTDSMLVVEQVNGRWDCKAPNLIPFRNECQKLKAELDVSIRWIGREQNQVADRLTRIAYREAINSDA